MKFSKKKLPKSQASFEVHYTPEELDAYLTKAVESLRKDLRLEGFRPGHVSFAIAEKHLQESVVVREAAELALKDAWAAIVQQEALQPIGEPAVQVLKLAPHNPLEFRIQVALLPDIKLPDYRLIASQSARKQVEVSEKEVDDALEWLRESRNAPEATDDFARGVGNFANVADLRASIQEGLLQEKTIKESERLRQEIVEHIADQSELEIPGILVEREKRVLLEQTKQAAEQVLQTPFEQYLAKIQKTEQELLDSFAQDAERRVKRFFVVREIASKEGIDATPQEVEQEAQTILRHYSDVQKAKQDIDPERLKEYTEGVIRHEKTLKFLESLCEAKPYAPEEDKI